MQEQELIVGDIFMVVSIAEKRDLILNACMKTGLRGFQPGLTQTRLYSHRIWLDA